MIPGFFLRLALEAAALVVRSLPSSLAYALADLVGRAWYRLAPSRRALVAANLRRVCEFVGRPSAGREFWLLVRRAFVEHARYYVELLRAPDYRFDEIDRIVHVADWPRIAAQLRSGGTVLVSAHLGNFEPMGIYFAARGFTPVAPIEEIEPRVLFEFLLRRRGGGRGVEVVPLSRSRRRMLEVLKSGGIAGLIADRDLGGDGLPVSFFGHPTTMPTGPATLAVLTGAPVIAGRCLRRGPDRFEAAGELLDVERSGDRRAAGEARTRASGERVERDIGEAPEQGWGAFQAYWPDLGRSL
jgi:KDO2-lipid IV(A) lauroyltransferase